MSRTVSLGGEWTLTGYGAPGDEKPSFGPFPARVPGAVQADLMRAGVLGDPNIGFNFLASEWVEHRVWRLERVFELKPENFVEKVYLLFDGLDSLGEISLNGEKIASFHSALEPLCADVTHCARLTGENKLRVTFFPANGLSRRMPFGFGELAPRAVQTGIWRDVRVKTVSGLNITGVSLEPRPAENGDHEIEAVLSADVHIGGRYTARYRVLDQRDALAATLDADVELRPCAQTVRHTVRVPQPQAAPHTLRVSLERGAIRADSAEARVTFRPKTPGRALRGVVWTPPGLYPGTTDPETLAPLMENLARAGVESLAVWDGCPASDDFYSLSDALGLAVEASPAPLPGGFPACAPPERIRAASAGRQNWPASPGSPLWALRCTLFPDSRAPSLDALCRETRFIQAMQTQIAAESAIRENRPFAAIANDPFLHFASSSLTDHGGLPRPALFALARAYAENAVTASLGELFVHRGKPFVCALHAAEGASLEAELCTPTGGCVAKRGFAPGDPAVFRADIPALSPDVLVLRLASRDGHGRELARNSYALAVPRENESLAAPFSRLARADITVEDENGRAVLVNGPSLALGVCARAGGALITPGFAHLLPGEKLALPCASADVTLEGFNV